MVTESIIACPLCGEKESVFHSNPLPNLYSEKMAMVMGEKEDDLLLYFHNVQCVTCSLIYKKKSYPEHVIQSIFSDVVPDHPKGWDVMSGRYSASNFLVELNKYSQAIEEKDNENENRYRRALLSIVDSIYPHESNKTLKEVLSEAIEQKNIELICQYTTSLEAVMQQPMPFKRFSGFSAPELWQYLELKCGALQQYDEIGCPLWGLLAYAKGLERDVRFVQRQELNYWSDNCQREGVHCVSWLNQKHDVKVVPWNEGESHNKRQLVGFFQYLDHLRFPNQFLDEIFNRYNSAAVILDGVDEPVYIQHSTGWTLNALQYVANRYKKTIHIDFDLIVPSGNRLYLFTD